MDLLDDSSIEKILSYLSFNERCKLKLVSQNFKRLICRSVSIINKLAIHHLVPVVNGHFKFTEDEYQLNDCVYVTDLNKFFDFNVEHLQNIEKLIIIGLDEVCRLNFKLNKLQHLELHHLTITDSQLLQSPKLDSFFNYQTEFQNCELKFNNAKKLTNLSISSKHFERIYKVVNEIDYLEIPEKIQFLVLDELVPFLKVRRLKMSTNIHTVIHLCEKFECLERLDINLMLDAWDKFTISHCLKTFLTEKRNNLDIFIFGTKLSKKSYEDIVFFSKTVLFDLVDIEDDQMILNINCCDDLNYVEEHDRMFSKFYQSVDTLVFQDLHLNGNVFIKLANVKEIIINLRKLFYQDFEIKEILIYFPQLNHLEIKATEEVNVSNRFLDTMSVHCEKIQFLKIQCFNQISFGFISRLKNLKYLILTSYHAIKNRQFTRILKPLKHLAYFRILFLKPEYGLAKEDLCDLKKKVNSMLKEELKYEEANFAITLHHRQKNPKVLVKYKFERKNLISKHFKDDDSKNFSDLCKIIDLNYSRPKKFSK